MKKNYDELLKKALYDIKKEEIDLLPSEDEIDYVFSDDFENKMETLINGKFEKKKNLSNILKKVAVIIIVLVSFMLITTSTADAHPIRIFDFFYKIYQSFVDISYEGNPEFDYDDTTYCLSYIPEGYKQIGFSTFSSNYKKTVFQKNNMDDRITLKQSNSSMRRNLSNIETEEYTINGIEVLIVNQKVDYRGIWIENGFCFELISPVELGKDIYYKNVGKLIVKEQAKNSP